MSYDLYLQSKNPNKKPLLREDFDKLNEIFKVEILKQDENQNITEFSASHKTSNDALPNEFFCDTEDGNYWTHLSYAATKEQFANFIKIATDIARFLDMDVFDPQFGKTLDLTEENSQNTQRFQTGQQTLQHVIKKFVVMPNTPTTSKFFTMYLITTKQPNTDRTVLLTQGKGSVYCSKVNPGETLLDVIKKELPLLTGSSEYKLKDIQDGGFDFDRHGNKLPRINLHIEVPYFDPHEKNLKYPFIWEPLG